MSAGPGNPARRGKGRPASDTVRAGEQAPPSCEPGHAGPEGPGSAAGPLARAARSADCSALELEAGHELDRTLCERARRLSQAPATATSSAQAEVLVFRLRDEQYAVDVRHLRSVQHRKDLTPVPCTPPWVAGMLNIHGEVVTVLDLAAALDPAGAPAPDAGAQVLLAECTQGRVGLLVDAVLEMQRLALDRLDRPLSGRDFAVGIAGAKTTVLNLDQLLSSGRFNVLEEVE